MLNAEEHLRPVGSHGSALSHNVVSSFGIYIKSKGIYKPENLMRNGSSRHDDAAHTK